MVLNRIYTRGGDSGETALGNGAQDCFHLVNAGFIERMSSDERGLFFGHRPRGCGVGFAQHSHKIGELCRDISIQVTIF